MSRTYRLRHLPKLKAKKFVDPHMHRRSKPWHEALEELALSCSTHSRFSMSWELAYDFPYPVASKIQHPWVGWGRIKPVKSWYKRNGNRRVRRHNRLLLMREEEVIESVEFFSKRHGWDIWYIT